MKDQKKKIKDTEDDSIQSKNILFSLFQVFWKLSSTIKIVLLFIHVLQSQISGAFQSISFIHWLSFVAAKRIFYQKCIL